MRAWAILVESMVLSASISSGRTTPATISSRTSKLTLISCLALDDEVAVRQHLGDDRGDVGDELLGAPDRAGAFALRRRVGLEQGIGLGAVRQHLGELVLEPEHAAHAHVLGVRAGAARLVVDLGPGR